MNLENQIEIKDSIFTLRIIGLMDYSTIESFKVEIPERINKVVVDFSGLDFIDSTGIGSILSLIYAASERKLPVEFIRMQDGTRELFDTVGVFRVMEALLKGGQ